MKKIMLTLALAVVATASAFAQIGVTAGYATSTTTYASGSSTYKDPALNGAYVEAFYQLPVSDNFFIEPALRYTFLTGKVSSSGSVASYTGTTTEHYVGVPVMAHFELPLAGDLKFFLFGGPTIEYGISGTYTANVGVAGISGSGTSNLFDEYYSPLDMLIGGGAGIEMNNFRLSAGYHYGFLDRNGKDTNSATRDSQILVGLSLLF